MSTLCQVDGCGRPTPDLAYVCQPCADQLARALGDIPALWDELTTTIAKQARFTDNPGRGGDKTLPFNPTASEVDWVLRNTLATWVKFVVDTRGIAGPIIPRRPTFASQRMFAHTVANPGTQRCGITYLPIEQCDHCRAGNPWRTST